MWPTVDVKQLISLEYGRPLPKEVRNKNGTYPVAGSNGIDGYHDEWLVEGPGIVVGRKGSAGKITWFQSNFWPIDTTYFVRHAQCCNKRWVYYFLQHSKISELVTMTGVPGLNRNDVYRLRVSLPPLSEQQRIVDILDQAYALQTKRIQVDEKMQRVLPALYYQNQRRNPQWPVVPLGSLSAPEKGSIRIGPFGSQLKREDLSDSGIHVVGIENILKEQFDGLGVRYISELKYSTLKAFTVLPDDVLITMMGTIGEVAVVPVGISLSIMDSHLLRFRVDHNKCLPEYIALVIKNDAKVRQSIEGKAHGAIMKGLNSTIIKSIPVSLPPICSQERIIETYRHLQKSAHQAKKVKLKIETLYNILLHRAFSGELTANWREAHIKELLQEIEFQTRKLGFTSPDKNDRLIKIPTITYSLMEKKAILLSYIVLRSQGAKHKIARVKLAKQYYIVNQFLPKPVTENFKAMVAGPLDNDVFSALELAQDRKWVVIEPQKVKEKPLSTGICISDTEKLAEDILGKAKTRVDEFLDTTKNWGWETLERWATVLSAINSLNGKVESLTVETIKSYISDIPVWKTKLDRGVFSNYNIEKTLCGLKHWGLFPKYQGADHDQLI